MMMQKGDILLTFDTLDASGIKKELILELRINA